MLCLLTPNVHDTLIITTTLQSGEFNYYNFINKKTSVKQFSRQHTAEEYQGQNPKADDLAP